jgi:hypothetical protein
MKGRFRMSSKMVLVIAVAVVGILPIMGQTRRTMKGQEARLNLNKPTVYLKFSSASKQDAATPDNTSPLRLELHNNTRWVIYCYLIPQKTSPGDYPLLYKVENLEGNRAINRAVGDVFVQKAVASGNSVSFRVLPEDLIKGQSIYVEFNYEWEARDHMSPYGVEPNHRVYFSQSDLPSGLRQKD